jgi:hypothetical protein
LKALMGIRDQLRPDVEKHLQKLKKLRVKNLVFYPGIIREPLIGSRVKSD